MSIMLHHRYLCNKYAASIMLCHRYLYNKYAASVVLDHMIKSFFTLVNVLCPCFQLMSLPTGCSIHNIIWLIGSFWSDEKFYNCCVSFLFSVHIYGRK